jgi:GPH family glycoside/pentoside/hexuronide:cation symporter
LTEPLHAESAESIDASAEPHPQGTETGTSRPVLFAYAAPALTNSFLFTSISMFLLKYSTDVLLIAPAMIGTIFGLSRLWDAVTDPVAGYLSDHTHTRWGRRRPWMLASAIPAGLTFLAIWAPPGGLEARSLTLWMTASIFLFYTAMTCFNVPYSALGAELSQGYHDRTRVFGARAFSDYAGVIMAAVLILILERAEDPRSAAARLAVLGGLLMIVAISWSVFRLREPRENQARGAGRNPYRAFGDVLRNPHARQLLAVFFLETLGFQSFVTLLPFMTQYILEQPGSTAYYLFGAIFTTLVSIPFWIPLSRRYGKVRVWNASLFAKALLFAALTQVGAGDTALIATITVLFGAASGAGSVLGPSLKADVIDSDEARTGERKEGTFFAAWGLAQKTAVGCSILISGLVLQWTGFAANEVQGDDALLGIRTLTSYLPLLLHVAAVGVLLRFGLSESAYSAVRQQIDAERARQSDSELR